MKYSRCKWVLLLFAAALASYDNPYLRGTYQKRFGSLGNDYPAYLAAGTIKHGR